MIKQYLDDIWDFGLLGITFISTLLITNVNQMLKIHLTPELLSDFITLFTQFTILGVVIYKFKLLREKNKKDGDHRE